MIDVAKATDKGSSEYLENIRKQIGAGYSDKAANKVHKKELEKNDFIKLMSVQLQHQDPTSPLKNEEMAAQLAQFSALEQMQNVNQTLEKMSRETKSRDSLMASQFIGKQVVTDSSRFELDENRSAELKFELQGDAENVAVAVLDQNQKVIREIPLDKLKKGNNSVKWDGRDEKGIESSVGAYSFRVTAYDAAKTPVKVETGIKGLVEGVEFENGQPLLLVGDKRLPLNEVSRIQEPGLKSQTKLDNKMENAPEMDVENNVTPKSIGDAKADPAPEVQTEPSVQTQAERPNESNAMMATRVPAAATSASKSFPEPREGLEGVELFNPGTKQL